MLMCLWSIWRCIGSEICSLVIIVLRLMLSWHLNSSLLSDILAFFDGISLQYLENRLYYYKWIIY